MEADEVINTQVVRDRSGVTMIGPSATAGQMVNGQVATCLYHCWSRLEKLEDEHAEIVYAIVKPSIKVHIYILPSSFHC
jgi:conserved oligomeric Golgi complex subunit 5